MSKLPPIPSEQRSFRGPAHADRDMGKAMAADETSNLNERGRSANIRQNLTPQRSTQDR